MTPSRPKRLSTWQYFCGFCCGVKKWVLENQKAALWIAGTALPLLGITGGGFAMAKIKDSAPAVHAVMLPDSTFQMLGKILTASEAVKNELVTTNNRLDRLEHGQARLVRVTMGIKGARESERRVRESEDAEKRFGADADTMHAPDVAGPNWRAPGTWGSW